MLSNLIKSIRTLTLQPRFSIVYGYVPRRGTFDKTGYIEGWLPRQTPYAKSRKPRLPQWEDQDQSWPSLMPKPTRYSGKALLAEVEKEEASKLTILRDFHVPDFRVGDVIQYKWIHSVSDGKENTYTGICVTRHKKKSLEASFKVMFRFCGVQVFMYVKLFSPFLRDIKIIKRGSGNVRNKQAMWKHIFTAQQLQAPLLKRTRKRRLEDGAKKAQKKQPSRLMLDNSQDPLLKKQTRQE